MSKATTNSEKVTFNATDVWLAYVRYLLDEHPDWWSTYSRKKRMTGAVYRKVVRGGVPGVEEVISFDRFMAIIKTYYLQAREHVIKGEVFHLGHSLGRIAARTISRNFKNRKVNFYETKKQPKVWDEEKQRWRPEKIIYYTNDEYSRIAWEKLSKLPNEKSYKFTPSRGNKTGKGFARAFSAALKMDPLLARKYKQYTTELL